MSELQLVMKWLIFRYQIRKATQLALIMAVIILPSIALASGMAAFHILAQGDQVVKEIAGKDLSYWLLTIAAMSITSWTLAVKYLVGQLESQRKANVELTGKLISYMDTDRTANALAILKFEATIDKLTEQLGRMNTRT